MNIDSLGSETVELLIKENLVNTISDLYLLIQMPFTIKERWKEMVKILFLV